MQDGQEFPRIDRDLSQVQQFSAKLKAKSARLDATADSLAATQLLAQEGFNAPRYSRVHVIFTFDCEPGQHPYQFVADGRMTRALQTVEIKPTFEDVVPAGGEGTVEDYLKHLHESTIVAAIEV